jgi:hypothetical protein
VTDAKLAAIANTIRHESLAGMGNVLEATTQLQDRAVPIVHKVATFLLRYAVCASLRAIDLHLPREPYPPSLQPLGAASHQPITHTARLDPVSDAR